MRRLTWLAAGFGLGAVVAHRVTQGGTQPVVMGVATGIASRVRRTVGAAVAEGRAEMAEHEVRLREVFGTDAPYEPNDRGADRSRR
jgi:hypothetical protein